MFILCVVFLTKENQYQLSRLFNINKIQKTMQYVSCTFCGLQHQQPHTVSCDTPVYQQHSDTIKMVNKKICKNCSHIIMNIQNFVKQSQIQFCSHKFKSRIFQYYPFLQMTNAKKSLQLVYATSMQQMQISRRSSQLKNLNNAKRTSNPQRSGEQTKEQTIHPYIAWLIQQIINKNYLTMQHLSKTLQYLIHLTSSMIDKKNMKILISPEERHQKIKNIILFLSEKINVTIDQLPEVIFMVNFLLCFMDASKAINTIIQLSNILVVYPHLLTWKTLLIDHQQRPNMQTPLSPATFDMKTSLILIDRLWIKIEYIIEISRRGQSILRQGLIRMSKLDQNLDLKQYKKKLSQALKLLLTRKQQLQYFNDQQLQLLYLLKQQRNSFTLILKQIMQQQQNMRIQLNKLQHKFRLQKDQYIQKIIKLNNKIQQLQNNNNNNANIINNHHNNLQQNKKYMDVKGESKFGQGLNQEIKMMGGQKQKQKQKMEKNQQLEAFLLEQIANKTNLNTFNHKYHVSDKQLDYYQDYSQYIIDQIAKMQEFIVKLSNKIKVVDDEKTRLLEIITRKQERLLGVIMEKDTIIERYEQALWTLENGIIVADGPLANRIQYIMQLFSKKEVKQDELDQLQPESNTLQKETAVKKDKNCEIY